MKRRIPIGVALIILLVQLVIQFTGGSSPALAPTPSAVSPSLARVATESAVIRRVIDGDTAELADGRKVRYIGIDTPEVSGKKECFGNQASEKNSELVEGKTVRLEKDVSETDRYGRLLRYVWLPEGMVNELLVREGFANASSYPPDIKYQELLREAERTARETKKGLWGSICNP